MVATEIGSAPFMIGRRLARSYSPQRSSPTDRRVCAYPKFGAPVTVTQ
jgi:hypothetical protein